MHIMNRKVIKLWDNSMLSDKYINLIPSELLDMGRVKFVGILVLENYIFISAPKLYEYQMDIMDDLKNIFHLIKKYSRNLSNTKNKKSYEGFPIYSYYRILDYYYSYGLYYELDSISLKNKLNKIDWKTTFKKSDKIIYNNDIIYNPIISSKYIREYNLLSEIMDYILFDANKILSIFNLHVSYDRFFNNIDYNTNLDFLITKLKEFKSRTFKDKISELIDNCIDYLLWKKNTGKLVGFYVEDFSLIWQDMVNTFLSKNENLKEIDIHVNNDYSLLQEHSIKVDSTASYDYNIFIDHYLRDNDKYYLLDSKYKEYHSDLDYKQISYHYFVKKKLDENSEIETVLIFPTNSDNNIKIILDRKEIDGLYLKYAELNMNRLIDYYLSN